MRAPTERGSVTLIHNPGAGDAAHPVAPILALLAAAGYRTRDVPSDGPWEEALQEPADIVAVLGGDGTVGPVLTALVGRSTPVAVLPGGTANNIARTMGVGGDAASLVAGWERAHVAPLDVWELRQGGRSARFVEAFGGGIIGRLIERGRAAEKPSLILGGALDRARHLLADVVAEAPEEVWRVEVDGADHSGRFIGVEAMGIRSIGPHATFAPDADPGDGRIDVVLIHEGMREPLLHGLASRATDRGAGDWPTFPTVGGRTVRLVPPADVPLHLDDTLWEQGPDDRSSSAALTIEHAGQVGYLSSA